jgi:CheY-like chemotaxis protein
MARILVIDDQDVQRGPVMSMLRDARYDVEGASSQEEGLDKATQGFDLFVVDIMVRRTAADLEDSDGIGGVKVIKQLRDNPETEAKPIVILSKRGDKGRVLEMLEPYGVQGYIEIKGTPEHEIVEIVRQAFETLPDSQ